MTPARPSWRRFPRRWKETLLVVALILPAIWPVWRYEIESLEELVDPLLVPEVSNPWNSSIAGSFASRENPDLIVHVERFRWVEEARDRIHQEPDWPLDDSFLPPSVIPPGEFAFRRRNLIVTIRPYRRSRAQPLPTEDAGIIRLAHQVDRNIADQQGVSKRWNLFGSWVFQKHLKPQLRSFQQWFEKWKDERFP